VKRGIAAVILGGALLVVGGCEIVLDIELRTLDVPDAAIESSSGTSGRGGSDGSAGSAGSGGAAGSAGTAGSSGAAGSAGGGGSAGTGGTADSGADATGGSGGCASDAGPPGPTGCCGECGNSGLCGPCATVGATVCVQAPGSASAWSYEIDAHEVTRGQFAEFKAAIAAGHRPTFGPECSFENSYVERSTGAPTVPANGVNWCTAFAYCQWRGKRLCGAVGSGQGYSFANADIGDATKSEWFNACSDGGQRRYPYGATYEPYRCVGYDWDGQPSFDMQTDIARPVTHSGGCVGGKSGLFDMSGNVWEWDNSCNATTGADDNCHVRGGSSFDDANSLVCNVGNYVRRGDSSAPVGIRCCKTVSGCGSQDAAAD
jgi:formylglycine-generating enzyme